MLTAHVNHLKQSVGCLIFVLQGWRINPFEFSNIMTLDSGREKRKT